jgi:hypothetical protein
VQKTQGLADERPQIGGGIVAEGDVDYNGGVEIAMLYYNKYYARRRNADYIEQRIRRMYITTGYRHWLRPYLSGALSVYSAYSMGDVVDVTDHRPTNPYLTTTAADVTEYGADLSIQAQLWGNDWLAIVADTRYSFALTKKRGERADMASVLLGLQYLVPKQGPAHAAGKGEGVIPP